MFKLNLFILFFILLLNNTYGYIEEGTGGFLKEYNTVGLKCIKYNDFVSGLNNTNPDIFTVMYNNFYLKDKKDKEEFENYNKFNQCKLNYTYNNKEQKYKNFTVYNKYKKTTSKSYDKIFEDTIIFEDFTNECTFSAKKGEKSIFILNGKEIGEYKSIFKMATYNTDDGKSKVIFSAELDNGKVVIVENGKNIFYSDIKEYKQGSLRYTNLGQVVFIEKDIFFGKEHLIVDGVQKEEFSGYSIYYSDNKDKRIDLIVSNQDSRAYYTSNIYFINGNKVNYNFNYISDVSYLSNGKIAYMGSNLDGDKLSYIIIDGKISKGYKSFERLYDLFSIHEKNVPFIETKNGDIYFIGKNEYGKYVIVKNDKELFVYDNKPDVNFKNTNHFIYTIEGKNGKYSLVIDGKIFGITFDKKPQINNQYLLGTSKEGIFMLDFRYNNLNNICINEDIKNNDDYKNILLRKQLDEKFSNIFSKYGRNLDSMNKLKNKLLLIDIKLKNISNKKLSIKSKKIIKLIDELLVGYLENINLIIKDLEENNNLNNVNKKVKYFSNLQISSGFFDKETGKLKNNYNINDILTNSDLFNFIYRFFNNTTVLSDNDIMYFKKNIKDYIEKNGYKVKKDFKIGAIKKDGKYSGEKVFVIEYKYIDGLSTDKRLIIGFGK